MVISQNAIMTFNFTYNIALMPLRLWLDNSCAMTAVTKVNFDAAQIKLLLAPQSFNCFCVFRVAKTVSRFLAIIGYRYPVSSIQLISDWMLDQPSWNWLVEIYRCYTFLALVMAAFTLAPGAFSECRWVNSAMAHCLNMHWKFIIRHQTCGMWV